jgi:hypothetical protein
VSAWETCGDAEGIFCRYINFTTEDTEKRGIGTWCRFGSGTEGFTREGTGNTEEERGIGIRCRIGSGTDGFTTEGHREHRGEIEG